MLRDEKWIAYAIRTLKAAQGGANTITRIAVEVGGSQSYLAKVIAILRKGGLLNEHTELIKPLDQIYVSQLIQLVHPSNADDSICKYVEACMLNSLRTVSIDQVLKNS